MEKGKGGVEVMRMKGSDVRNVDRCARLGRLIECHSRIFMSVTHTEECEQRQHDGAMSRRFD
ncbi:hypothetical protein E2C01_066559 [Portunus trituberculatus]|uniref:Uncharacterized protein n=1 Tax=Portunus trituberculatus TaxID=210409 RepID=A0A5B7HHF0_PORTR|nr:hypothetical protein [Portunus trituberculatus]